MISRLRHVAGFGLALGKGIAQRWRSPYRRVTRGTPDYRERMIRVAHEEGRTPRLLTHQMGRAERVSRILDGPDPADAGPYLLDYSIRRGEPTPAMLVAPGGGYVIRAELHEGIEVAHWLNDLGISAFVLNYRVSPYRHPAPLHDAARCVRFLRANAKRFAIDPGRIGLMGFSAGGHLAATLGTHCDAGDPAAEDPIERESSRPDLLVLGYAAIDFGRYLRGASSSSLTGDAPSPEMLDALATQKHVGPDTPPTFLWTCRTDPTVPYEQTELFADALAREGVPHACHLFDTGAHGSGLAQHEPEAAAWPRLCEEWMRERDFLRASEEPHDPGNDPEVGGTASGTNGLVDAPACGR